MRKFLEHILTSESRVAIATSLLATIAYCGAIVLVCVVLSLAGAQKDDSSLARRGTTSDTLSSMPL